MGSIASYSVVLLMIETLRNMSLGEVVLPLVQICEGLDDIIPRGLCAVKVMTLLKT